MKMRFLLVPALLAAGSLTVLNSSADPILPYQQPIEQQLNSDIMGGSPDTATLNRALTAYQKNSKSLRGDITILRNLNNLLDDVAGYDSLLSTAALDYQSDFQGRRDAIYAQLVPAPISESKTVARTALRRVDNSLSNAVNAASTAVRIRHLDLAAQRLGIASNNVQRALRVRPGFSKMNARIGVLSFIADRGNVFGAGDFLNNEGGVVGEFATNGTLSVTAFDSGPVLRGLHLDLSGVSGAYPTTYPLGVGENRAFYQARDLRRKEEFDFAASPTLTNNVVTNAFVTIDYIGTNSISLGTNTIPTGGYVLGRFAFLGTNSAFLSPNTNTVVTVSEGEFQLNFNINVSTDTNGVPIAPE